MLVTGPWSLAPQWLDVRSNADAAPGAQAALLSPGSPERGPGPAPAPPAPPRPQAPPPRPARPPRPPAPAPVPPSGELRLPTPEQNLQNIKQEYSGHQRWRRLEVVLRVQLALQKSGLAPSTHSTDAQVLLMKKDQPRLLKDKGDKIGEEYEQILNTKLAGHGTRPISWVSEAFLHYLRTRFDLKRWPCTFFAAGLISHFSSKPLHPENT
uniref:Uncharacterized protein n=1 Tax=Urocitellus parryii TaxID=9999 RepID=A0A8D2HTP2_UROPR